MMLRRSIFGLMAVVGVLAVTAGTASAYHGHHHHGYRGGYRGGYPYAYAPRRVIVNPVPVYTYPPAYGYGYPIQPGCVQPGLGVSTPGFGFYIR